MKSITIHNLESDLNIQIRRKARLEGKSLNQTIKSLLRRSLGISKTNIRNKDFDEFFGVWSTSEAKNIEKALEDFERIDPQDWK